MLSRHPRAEEPQSVQKWYFFGDIKKNANTAFLHNQDRSRQIAW